MAALLTVCACIAGYMLFRRALFVFANCSYRSPRACAFAFSKRYPALWGVQWARGLYDRSFGVSKSTKTANKAPNGKMVAGGKRKN
jgi:hypothetical protein